MATETYCNECFRFTKATYKLKYKPYYTLCVNHFEQLKKLFPKLAQEFERFRFY